MQQKGGKYSWQPGSLLREEDNNETIYPSLNTDSLFASRMKQNPNTCATTRKYACAGETGNSHLYDATIEHSKE